MRQPYLAARLQGFGTTIFAEMSALATATGSVNLGQGFPDTDGPDLILDAAVEAIRSGHNQYPPGRGVPALLEAIARHQAEWYGLDVAPESEILVTAGATEAVAAALLGLCDPGDEVVVFEPLYDSYAACVAMAGAVRRVVTLRRTGTPPGWAFDPDELEAAVTAKTRLVLLNTPHNPTGKVFDREELDLIATLCRDRDLLAVTDEVYEHLVYAGEHIPLATLPGMRDRTLTISSAGKTFSVTGWKVGWVCGPEPLVDAVRAAKQFLTYVNGGPLQHAVAAALSAPRGVLTAAGHDLARQRDVLCDGLEALGFDVVRPDATYFATTDIRSIGESDGWAFCRALPDRCGVVAIPSAVFYDDKQAGAPYVRWAFCKRPEVLEEALRRLARWSG